MFVVFEGIDGSGKTTISNRVAKSLRARGLDVEHLREGGAFASKVTQGIRDFCRDARNMALTPRAELMLYVAREVQLAEEVLRPALDRADVVIADRYFYTAEVLAGAGRDLAPDEIRPIVQTAAAGVWPQLAFLIDVDPSVARGRRKVSKMMNPADRRPVSRKGLTGSGLQVRLRAGYKALAESDPARWVIVDNSDADLDQVVAAVTDTILRARGGEAVSGGHLQVGAATPAAAPADSVAAAYQAFLAWVDRRTFREPTLAAYVLAGMSGAEIDTRRLSLAGAAPKVIARGLRGLSDPVSWRLRRLLLDAAPSEVALSLEATIPSTSDAWTLRELLSDGAPAAVAASLEGLDDETAWALRAELYERAPEAVLASLALLDSPRAWELRARWLSERGGLDRAGQVGHRARRRAGLGDAQGRPRERAGGCPRVAEGRHQRPGLELARKGHRARPQGGALDDRRNGRRARLGAPGGERPAGAGGAGLDGRPRPPHRLGPARELPRHLAGQHDQEPGRAGERPPRPRAPDARPGGSPRPDLVAEAGRQHRDRRQPDPSRHGRLKCPPST